MSEYTEKLMEMTNTMTPAQQKAFWGWWRKKDITFTKEDVEELLERVKLFNAGAIDEYLTRHVDKVFQEWLDERNFSG
jgi:hypothetical protein